MLPVIVSVQLFSFYLNILIPALAKFYYAFFLIFIIVPFFLNFFGDSKSARVIRKASNFH